MTQLETAIIVVGGALWYALATCLVWVWLDWLYRFDTGKVLTAVLWPVTLPFLLALYVRSARTTTATTLPKATAREGKP